MDDDSSDGGTSPVSRGADHAPKKRRLQGACDACRKKKIKCDSALKPGSICSNCVSAGLECTHYAPKQTKKSSQKRRANYSASQPVTTNEQFVFSYIRALEQRIDKLENLLRTVNPEAELFPTAASSPSPERVAEAPTVSRMFSDLRTRASPSIGEQAVFSSPSASSLHLGLSPNVGQSSDEEDLAQSSLEEHLSKLALKDRFYGHSSNLKLVQDATNFKSQLTGASAASLIGKLRRPMYWNIRSWELDFAMSQSPRYVYPDQDLTETLISIYFARIHPVLPILHRPTFESAFKDGLHFRDTGFGMTLLMACAVASRYSSDPRVLLDEDPTGLSCGWKYFRQIPIYRNSIVASVTIYDMQYYCLSVLYVMGTGVIQAGWGLIALGIRLAQERGVHLRKAPSHKLTIEDEMWRRGLWCLLLQDRFVSAFVGRPCAMRDEDFNFDFPIDCDDEYWETYNPINAFKQPAGKPSLMTSFICHLKLSEIMAFALRTLYSTKKSKLLSGLIGNEWEERVVAELDSALNQWKDSLPDHLRWDTIREDSAFIHQSLSLHAAFYYVQIQVHRPFLRKLSNHSFPSLAICTNAARSCIHMLVTAMQRGIRPFSDIMMSAFASGIILLMNIWVGRRGGMRVQIDKELAEVRKCIEVLSVCEKRWHLAGRLSDILTELSSLQDAHLSQDIPSTKKRRRDSLPEREPARNLVTVIPSGLEPLQSISARDVVSETHPRNIYGEESPFPSNNSQNVPLSYQPQVDATYNPFSASSDWELSTLLLTQLGYMESLPSATSSSAGNSMFSSDAINPHDQQNASSGGYFSTPQLVHTNESTTIPAQSIFATESGTEGLPSMDGDAHWLLNAPIAFDVDEWESYITNIGLSNGNTEGAQFGI